MLSGSRRRREGRLGRRQADSARPIVALLRFAAAPPGAKGSVQFSAPLVVRVVRATPTRGGEYDEPLVAD